MKPSYALAIPSAWQSVARVFIALGDEHRQRILLMFDQAEEITVGDIAAATSLSRPAVSHHLKILREAGVLQARKVGKEVFCRIDKPFLQQALRDVLDYIDTEL